MRAHLFGIAAALLFAVPSSAQPSQPQAVVQMVMRDCFRDQEVGQHPPQKSGATYLYIVTLMTESKSGQYGSDVSWKVGTSLKQACDLALAESGEIIPSRPGNWTVQGAVAVLIPDDVLRKGLAH